MSRFLDRARFRRDHRWMPGQLSAFLDGELSPAQRARLQRHAHACPECRRLLAGLRGMLAAMQRLPAPGGANAPQIAAAVRVALDEPPAP